MKIGIGLLSATIALAICSCSNDSPAPTDADAAMPPATAQVPPSASSRAPEGTTEKRFPTGKGKGAALPLVAGQSVSGTHHSNDTGNLAGFGVRIGNYRNSSDGMLQLHACIEGVCREASLVLRGTKDNDYLIFPLSPALPVAADQAVTYTLTRSADATNRVAIWTYPSLGDHDFLRDTSNNVTGTIPRLAFYIEE